MGLTPRDPAYYTQHGESPAQARAAAHAYRMHQQSQADTHTTRTGGRPKNYVGGKPGGATDSADLGKVTRYSLSPGLKGTRAGGLITGSQSGNEQSQHVFAMQKFLRNKGYNVTVDGKMGPQTKAAMNAWTVGGPKDPRINAAEWNMAQRGEGKLAGSKQGTINHPGNNVQGSGGGGGGHHAPPPSGGTNFGGLGGGAGLKMVPGSYADQEANLQFDPQINDLIQQMATAKGQGAQDVHDINHWYGTVQNVLSRAKGATEANGNQAVAHDQNLTKAIIDSLGGGANAASGSVGAWGLRGAQTQEANNASEQAYFSNMAPIMQDEAAGASARQTAMNNQAQQGLTSKLNSLYGQKGAAKADALMKIMQYNNQLRQQGYGNHLSAVQTAAAAAMTGAQIQGLNATTKNASGTGNPPWMHMTTPDRQKLLDLAMQGLVDTKTGALLPGDDMAKAWKHVRNYLVSQGYSNARYTGSGELAPPPRNAASRSMRGMILTALGGARDRQTYNHANNVPGY